MAEIPLAVPACSLANRRDPLAHLSGQPAGTAGYRHSPKTAIPPFSNDAEFFPGMTTNGVSPS
jgi:hypothetical protein